jgi:hypothetical protein
MKIPKGVLRIYQILSAVVILAGIAVPVQAQVNQGELEQEFAPVTFMNYEGPHARIDTREEIRQIGVGLGRAVAAGAANAGTSGRYFVIHSVTGPDGGKLDADIFGLGVDVGVDHIRNLRTIIQGYLQEAYGYSASDAALLAEYITIYNAVYRGDWDYFSARYKTPVVQNLTREKAGLSIRYDEWPGRTLMLIPLGSTGLSSIDTSTISDSRVIEELRKEDDYGVQQRQDMVGLMEREAAQAEGRAQVEREAIREEESRITQERQQAEQDRQQVAQERQQTQEDLEAGRITEEQARQQQQDQDRRDQEAAARQEDLSNQEAALDQRREAAQQQEDLAQQRYDEAQQQRQGIADDQQAVITQDAPTGIIGMAIEKGEIGMGRIVRLDPATGQEISRSPVNTVYVRSVTLINNRIIAIAGENVGNGAVRLIEINANNLEMAKQGDNDLHPGSLIWVNGNDLYAIMVNLQDNTCYLGRFDTNLGMQARSQAQVHPQATVTIQQNYLITQKPDGSAMILNPSTLR